MCPRQVLAVRMVLVNISGLMLKLQAVLYFIPLINVHLLRNVLLECRFLCETFSYIISVGS